METKRGKWNFDHVFTGTLDERGLKAKYLLEGLEELRTQQRQQYAMAFVTNEPPEQRWATILELDEVAKAFCENPRTLATLREKAKEKLGEVGAGMIDRLETEFLALLRKGE